MHSKFKQLEQLVRSRKVREKVEITIEPFPAPPGAPNLHFDHDRIFGVGTIATIAGYRVLTFVSPPSSGTPRVKQGSRLCDVINKIVFPNHLEVMRTSRSRT